jgi:replicative DNA helicase
MSYDLPNADLQLEGLINQFGGSTSTVTEDRPKIDWESDQAVIDRAVKYLDKMPAAIEGQNGSKECFKAACVLRKGFGLTFDQAMDAIQSWNSRCDPPWSEHELTHKLNDAGKQSGDVGYLRRTKIENFDRVKIPAYKEPEKKPEEKPVIRTTLRDAAMQHLEVIRNGMPSVIPLGIAEIDDAVGGGVQYGEMVVVGARPGHGKSAFALQVVDSMTGRGIPSAFMSEEMSTLMLGQRTTQLISEIPQESWRHRPQVLESQIDRHFQDRADCFLIQNSRTAENIAKEIGKLSKEEGVRVVAVDYLQLLTNAKKSRYETVTETSVILRQACSENNVVMIALAQIGRAIETRTSYSPSMSDLKESGQIEQDADVILFLVWPHKIDSQLPWDEYMIYVGKNRSRETRRFMTQMTFEPGRQRIVPSKNSVGDWANI